jgi:hypothetical protein
MMMDRMTTPKTRNFFIDDYSPYISGFLFTAKPLPGTKQRTSPNIDLLSPGFRLKNILYWFDFKLSITARDFAAGASWIHGSNFT